VRRSDEFLLGKAADSEKVFVDVGDNSPEIGLGYDRVMLCEGILHIGYRHVDFHGRFLFLLFVVKSWYS
jgi:hypothetical protein